MTRVTSSGTTNFNPTLGDLVIEAYSRCQIRPTSFTADHMLQARQSAQFLLSEWATKPNTPNLWKISLQQIQLVQGVATYAVPQNVVAILDYYIRQFQLAAPVSLTNAFSTDTTTPTTITLTWPNHGQVVGNQISVPIAVSVGGIILQNFYQVLSVLSGSQITFTAAQSVTGTVTNGGVVPTFTTSQGSSTVTVTLPNHGLAAGNAFTVEAAATVGGLTLSGPYMVATVPTSSTFTIAANGPAGSSGTVAENGGAAQVSGQNANVSPDDRVIFPISRSEYSAIPDKFDQGFPTVVWWDRTINSTVNFWLTPDGNGPYVLNYYAMTQIEDAVLPGGVTMDLPYRAYDAFAAGLAARLARKFAPPLVGDLRLEAQMAWEAFSKQDSEDVPLYISPGLWSYYR